MKGRFKTALMLCVSILGITDANHALAASPIGLWRVTSFLEPDLDPSASRDLCFRRDRTFSEFHSEPNEFFSGFWLKRDDRIRFVGTQILAVNLGFQNRTANFGQCINSVRLQENFTNLILNGDNAATSAGNFIARRIDPSC